MGGYFLRGDKLKKRKNTTKCIVGWCLMNGIAWVWCSYVLAFLGKTDIAEGLSKVAVTEIVGVVLIYCVKSLFEKRDGFGAVGKVDLPPAEYVKKDTSAPRRDL